MSNETKITAEVKGKTIDKEFISSFISYLLDLFLNKKIKGVMISTDVIHIQLNKE